MRRYFLLSLLIPMTTVWGVTSSWLDNMSGNWSDSAKWAPPTVPNGPTDEAFFDIVYTNPIVTTIDIPVEVDLISFSNIKPVTFLGPGPLTLNGPTGILANSTDPIDFSNVPVIVIGSVRIEVFPGLFNPITMGPISGTGSLRLISNVTMTLNGPGTYEGATLVESTGGTGIFLANGPSAISGKSTITIDSGTLRLGTNDGVNTGGSIDQMGGGFDLNGFRQTLDSLKATGAIAMNGGQLTLTNSTNPLTLDSGASLASGGTLRFTSGNPGTVLVTNGSSSITSDVVFQHTLHQIEVDGGGNTLTISGSVTGAIEKVGAGTLVLTQAGTPSLTRLIWNEGGVTLPNGLTLTGRNNPLALNVDGALIDNLSLTGQAPGTVSVGPLTMSAMLTGALDLGGIVRTFDIADGSAATELTITATTTNGGIQKEGPGRMDLTQASPVTLTSLVYNEGTITATNGFVLTDTSTPLSMGSTTLTDPVSLTGATGSIVANGQSGSAILTSTALLDIGSAMRPVEVASGSTLTIDSVISGAGGLDKQGAGLLELSDASANSYLGTTTVSAGTLSLDKPSSVAAVGGDVVVNGGLLQTMAVDQFAPTSKVTVNEGTLDLLGNDQAFSSLTYLGGDVTNGATLSLSGPSTSLTLGNVTLDSDVTLTGMSGDIAHTTGGSATVTGTVTIAGGQRTLTTNGTLAIEGGLTGGGGLNKAGSGTLNLSGTGTLAGPLNINQGRLNALGTVGASLTTVAKGATLGGTGTVNGLVKCSGALSPGTSVGTLSVMGDLDFLAVSTLEIEIDSPTSFDKLLVSGGVTINPNTTLKAMPDFTVTPTFSIVVMEAGSLSGEFGNVITDSLLTRVVPIYDATTLTLRVEENDLNFTAPPNAVAVRNGVLEINPPPGTDLRTVVQFVIDQNSTEVAADAFNQMHVAPFTALALSQQRAAVAIADSLSNRLNSLMTTCSLIAPCQLTLWGSLTGDLSVQSTLADRQGYRSGSAVGVLGAEYAYSYSTLMGAFLGYSYGDINWHRKGCGDVNSFYVGGYAGYIGRCFYALGSLFGGYNKYATQRTVQFITLNRSATGQHDGQQIGTSLELGSTFCMRCVALQPYASLLYTHLWEDGFTENGSGDLDLKVLSKTSDLVRTEVGARLSWAVAISPYLEIAWAQETRPSGITEKARFVRTDPLMTFRGINPSHALFHIGTGVSASLMDDLLILSLHYTADVTNRYSTQQLQGQLALTF